MELTKEQIDKINKSVNINWDQGVYTEPFGVPDNLKELVIYMRYSPGGVSGGSCWDSSNPQSYCNYGTPDDFEALEKFLNEIAPNISFLHFREIERMVESNEITDYEYYGNRTDYLIKFIKVSSVLEKLEKLGYQI